MKNFQKLAVIIAVIMVVSGIIASYAHAVTPSLSVATINNDWVRVTAQGDTHSPVYLYYMPAGSQSWAALSSIGTTDSAGRFTTTLSSNTYAIPAGTKVYVMINNEQSSQVTWPYYNSSQALNLSKTSVELMQGQKVAITSAKGSLYISGNSNPNNVNAYANGNVVTLSVPSNASRGSATITVCTSITAVPCAPIYVDIQNAQSSHPYDDTWIGLSQNTVNVASGQSQIVTLHGSGSYYLSNTSNTSSVASTLNGNELQVKGITIGTAIVSVCSSIHNSAKNDPCVSLNVNVTAAPAVNREPTSVYLHQVPYTGSSTTNIMLFVTALGLWTAGISYFLVRRKAFRA